MKLSKHFSWLAPYINLAIPHIKNLYLLKRISARSPRKNQVQRCNAMTTWTSEGDYKITLYRSYQDIESLKPLRISITNYSKIDILEYLAHELAHLQHWEHTTDHKKLENKLHSLFMNRLKREGYVSEEESED